MSQMKRRLRAKSWWSKMDQHIENFVKKCTACTLVSAPPPAEPMKRTELPAAAWQYLAMDFLGPLPSGHHIFTIIDYFSRWFELEIMSRIDSVETIRRLKIIFARFGFPLSITADNGKQLISQEMKSYLEEHNIRLISTVPFWPQMNGEVERQNRSLLKRLRIYQNTEGNWMDHLHKYLIMYRSTPHSVTLRTPAELMFGRNIRDKLPTIHQAMETDYELADRDKQEKHKGGEYGNMKRRAEPSDIQVGDTVVTKRQLVSNKLATPYEPTPYQVIQRSGPEVKIKSTATSAIYRRNIAHIKKLPQPTVHASTNSQPQPPQSSSSTSSPVISTASAPTAATAPTTNTAAIRPPSSRIRRPPTRYAIQ